MSLVPDKQKSLINRLQMKNQNKWILLINSSLEVKFWKLSFLGKKRKDAWMLKYLATFSLGMQFWPKLSKEESRLLWLKIKKEFIRPFWLLWQTIWNKTIPFTRCCLSLWCPTFRMSKRLSPRSTELIWLASILNMPKLDKFTIADFYACKLWSTLWRVSRLWAVVSTKNVTRKFLKSQPPTSSR